MKSALTLLILVLSSNLYCQDNNLRLGVNLNSYISNYTGLGFGGALTLDFNKRNQIAIGTKIPIQRISRTKTDLYEDDFMLLDANYKFFFLKETTKFRPYAILNVEYSYWHYQYEFYYNEGDEIFHPMGDAVFGPFVTFDDSFNLKKEIKSHGLNLYAGIGAEVPIWKNLYFSGYIGAGFGFNSLRWTYTNTDVSSLVYDYQQTLRIESKIALQALGGLGYRFN